MSIKTCVKCNTELKGKYQKYFCSRSCSAGFNNKSKDYKSMDRSKTISLRQDIKKENESNYSINPKACVNCNNTLSYSMRYRKTCSIECYEIINKDNAQKGGLASAQKITKRSKNEIELFDLCNNHFENVTSNEPIFDGWDADILIYDHKIAILWNGDWHYKEMSFTKQSLLQVQTRDKHKLKLIDKHGWKSYVIEDSSANPKSPKDAFKELLTYINGAPGR